MTTSEEYNDLVTSFSSGLKRYMEFNAHKPTHVVVNRDTMQKIVEYQMPDISEDRINKMLDDECEFMGHKCIITTVIKENCFYFLRDE